MNDAVENLSEKQKSAISKRKLGIRRGGNHHEISAHLNKISPKVRQTARRIPCSKTASSIAVLLELKFSKRNLNC